MAHMATSSSPSTSGTEIPDSPETVVIDLDTVEKTHLAGKGNFLWKVPYGDDFIVVKIYFGTRGRYIDCKKTLTNYLLQDRTSAMPWGRFRTERDSFLAWEHHGFRCFRRLDHIWIKGLPADGYVVMEYLPGLHFREYFKDESVDFGERMTLFRRWLLEWHRRHRISVEQGHNLLHHENFDVKHVMIVDGEFLYFDFEVAFRSRNMADLVGREILAFMRSVGKFFGEEIYWRMMRELLEHYPDRNLLEAAWAHAFQNPRLHMRIGRRLEAALQPKHRKRFSKYQVARDLRKLLDNPDQLPKGRQDR